MILAHCGVKGKENTKGKAFQTIAGAKRFARSHNPDELEFIRLTIHLTKDELCGEMWFDALDSVLNSDTAGIGERAP